MSSLATDLAVYAEIILYRQWIRPLMLQLLLLGATTGEFLALTRISNDDGQRRVSFSEDLESLACFCSTFL